MLDANHTHWISSQMLHEIWIRWNTHLKVNQVVRITRQKYKVSQSFHKNRIL